MIFVVANSDARSFVAQYARVERQLQACLESMKDVKGRQKNTVNLNLVYVSILISLNTVLIASLV